MNNADFGKPRISAPPPHENLIGNRGTGLCCGIVSGRGFVCLRMQTTVDLWKLWITLFKKEFPVENILIAVDFKFQKFYYMHRNYFDSVVII